MGTFYDEWLAAGERIQEEFRRSPMIAHDRNIPWVRTRQDAKVKLMVANELGFPTMGGCVLKARDSCRLAHRETCSRRRIHSHPSGPGIQCC